MLETLRAGAGPAAGAAVAAQPAGGPRPGDDLPEVPGEGPAAAVRSAAALADDLERCLAGEPILARRTGPVERAAKWRGGGRRSRRWSSRCCVLLASLLRTGVLFLRGGRPIAGGGRMNAAKAMTLAKAEARAKAVAVGSGRGPAAAGLRQPHQHRPPRGWGRQCRPGRGPALRLPGRLAAAGSGIMSSGCVTASPTYWAGMPRGGCSAWRSAPRATWIASGAGMAWADAATTTPGEVILWDTRAGRQLEKARRSHRRRAARDRPGRGHQPRWGVDCHGRRLLPSQTRGSGDPLERADR